MITEPEILKGRDPMDVETLKMQAQRFIMCNRGFGQKHAYAYLAGARYILRVIQMQTNSEKIGQNLQGI